MKIITFTRSSSYSLNIKFRRTEMRKRKSLLVVSLVLALILTTLAAACTETEATTTTKTTTTTQTATETVKAIEIRIAGAMPPGHPISASILSWKDKVEEATNGRVTVTFFEGGTFGESEELYDMALEGVVEAVHTAEFWTGGRFPIIEGLNNLPFNIENIGDILAVDNALYEAGLLKELEPFKLLYFTPAAALSFFTKEKINTMEDLAGMKLRASGTAADAVALMGATPVNAPGSEEYMMLERGTLDGNITGADNALSRKLYEVIDYGNKNVFAGGGFVFIMNKDFWNSLPSDIQKIIDDIDVELAQQHLIDQQAAIDESWAELEKYITVYTISEEEMDRWRQTVAPITDKWIADREAQGLPGQEAYDLMQEILAERHGD
jgi:TRAP-type C4-dicarboxylate transport system substrate-binding protein